MNWQIKDYLEGAEVFFHYRQSQGEDFLAVPGERKGGGFFEVQVPIKIKVEPYWDISVSETRGLERATSEHAQLEVKDQVIEGIECYVSMKNHDRLQSSAVSYHDLVYLTKTKYEPIQGHLDIEKNQYHFTLFQHFSGNQNLVSVKAKIYSGNNLVEEKALELLEGGNQNPQFVLSYDASGKNISRILLQASYQDGITFEKQVYGN